MTVTFLVATAAVGTTKIAVCPCVGCHMQIDLSDDYLLLLMFADSNWSETIQPIQIGDGEGNAETLVIDEQQFKDTVGMIRTLQEMEKEDQEAGGPGYTASSDGREIEIDPRSVRPLN